MKNKRSFQDLLNTIRGARMVAQIAGVPFVLNVQLNVQRRKDMSNKKEPKHPNRVKDPNRVRDAEDRMFEHLQPGKVYKLTLVPSHLFTYRTTLFSDACLDQPINSSLETGKAVIYLGRKRVGSGLFHKIVYGDQVGWVTSSPGIRFRRYTKRMMARLEGDQGDGEQFQGGTASAEVQEG